MKIIIIAFIVLFAGCATKPPADQPPWLGTMKNACLPEAITMTAGLREKGIQARVLSIHTSEWGHATCAYMYPPGANKLWVWDSYWQSIPLRAWWDDPMSIAKAWMKWRNDYSPIRSAYFHD